jgi:hypothetical protein
MTTSASPVLRSLAWVPLALIVALLAISSITAYGGLSSADASDTITVTGQVNKAVYMDASGCSAPSALDIGDLVPGDPWKRTTSDCAILFGSSNSALGADLTVFEDPGAPASPPGAMKCIVASCTGGSWDGQLGDVAPNSSPPGSNASAFGAQLESASGLATASWSIGDTNPIDTSDTPCSTTGVGDGTCAFRFGASADTTADGPGAYQAQVQYLVLAR